MRNKLKVLFLFFVITVVSLGCIESQKLPDPNETEIATPEPTISTTEQKMPAYNITETLKINDTFMTWSRGYFSNSSYKQPYFRVITNYSAWNAFLDEQGYRRMGGIFEGELYPGINAWPETITSTDFNDYFIISAMMGYQSKWSPEIEIKNISRINKTVNVTVRMYKPSSGGAVVTFPYHIVIVKREVLPIGNSTFVFMDTEGKKLESIIISLEAPVEDVNTTQTPANSTQSQLIQEKIKSKLIGLEITYSDKRGELEKYTVNESDIKMINETWLDNKRVWKLRIGVGISWDYYFDETGENIVKTVQLFRT